MIEMKLMIVRSVDRQTACYVYVNDYKLNDLGRVISLVAGEDVWAIESSFFWRRNCAISMR